MSMRSDQIIRRSGGFTLLELLIVIAVITILAALTFVALNPWARFQDSHNAKRWNDVNAVLSAIKLHQVDNNGTYLSAIDSLTASTSYQIGTGSSCNDTCSYPSTTLSSTCADLSPLVSSGYLASVPIDTYTTGASAAETRYYLVKYSNGTLMVGACGEEQGTKSSVPVISVTR
jgi:prepilin-type N-terminal cleavage/methylation domain-containing protein